MRNRLIIIPNFGAFVLAIALAMLAPHMGVHNQVAVFYASMFPALLLWWYFVGAMGRWLMDRLRRFSLRHNTA
jgi:membrane protein implicated in regulation of membrane protease activity